jgi:RES domain-containing protein
VVLAAAVRRIHWNPACRIVPTRHPTVYLFDRVAGPEDFEALYALESLTNDRIREEYGALSLVAPGDRVFGPGSGPIMAAFTHLNPLGSRFSDGSYGVFYAADDRATAIAETRYHHARFLEATHVPPMSLAMRLYHVTIDAKLHDLRGEGVDPAIHDPDSYVASRKVGGALRQEGSAGVVYRSVRREGGRCVGLFKPNGARDCQHAAHLLYVWDGARFSGVYEEVS